jgi:hypothetical protein
MIIPEKIKKVIEDTIRDTASEIALANAKIEELKAEVERLNQELEAEYAILDMQEAPKERKKPGRKKKTEKGEEKEMVTPKELRSAEQVRVHNRYVKNKARKAAEKEAAEKPHIETVEEVNAKARAAGMTYGEYISQELIKRQHEEMERSRLARRRKREEEQSERERILEQNPSNGLSDPEEEGAACEA